ncbi:MAG: ABC transporter substrate-binding protein [Zoogloea sp.]|uniref:ABC transporter substrate-binding protein n=1 Tax=Zoogloea sp. TaxID=49181 RepID=UPI003F2BC28B
MMRQWICLALALPAVALADVTVGITLSATGPASALGVSQKNSVELLPANIGGEKVNWIVLDDASDPTNAAKNAKKLVDENKVDILIGSSIVATCKAVLEVAVANKTPLVAMAPFDLPPEKDHWVFKVVQPISLMAKALVDQMVSQNVKTVGFIGFSDPYGDAWLAEAQKYAETKGIKFIASERFARSDTSTTGQVLKVLAAKPDAVLIGASGTPATIPQIALVERGYKGPIYQTAAAVGKDVLRVGGKAMEGSVAVAGPIVVWNQLPDSHPSKKASAAYAKAYEAKYGEGSMVPQGGHFWDAAALVSRAIPLALKKAKPGSEAFRAALRDAIEGEREIVGVHGVFNMEPNDHFGQDARARVLVKVENGAYKLIK